MIILAIDPGPKESAYVFYRSDKTILRHGYELNDMIIHNVIWPYEEDLPVVIEWIEGYGLTVGRETFDTCFWAGRFAQATAGNYHLLGRKAIKLHLCNNIRARDKDVRQALIDKLGEPGTKKNSGPTYGIVGDEWAALAVAVTFAETTR